MRIRRAAAACAALLFVVACGAGEETRTYTVRGQVARVVDSGRSLAIDHEEIPGYMAAMQMTLPVQDAAQAKPLRPGDKVRFELFVSGESAVIGAIEKLPADTALELASGS
ncbi:MAG: copper-binding protein [Myxococcota bacterium]|nr:copper-binding protein [Myxococcota bacterium]